MAPQGSSDRYRSKHVNFNLALAALRRFVAEPQRTEAVEAGIIQGFEFSFEQAWKLLQAVAASEGLDAPTPRLAIGAALKIGLVSDEQLWLDMLQGRNLSSHTYRRELARELVSRIEERFLGGFVVLEEALVGYRPP
jgi:nucleotidyltransferase substrate binding protein (TIGR01987 family)